MSDLQFTVAPEVRSLGVRGAYVTIHGLQNSKSAPELEQLRSVLCAELSFPEGFVESNPELQGFRALHEKIGRSNRRFPAASESLVRLFQRTGIIPAINVIVDIYNCVSLETCLALGAHDMSRIDGNVTLRLTDGTERFVPLGATVPEPVGAGEYCYIDSANEVLCRLEHKQVEKTKVTIETTDCFYVIQGSAETSRAALDGALNRLTSLTTKFCGGSVGKVWVEA